MSVYEYEFDYSDIETNLYKEGNEWGVLKYEWVPMTSEDHKALCDRYYDPEGGPSEYKGCTQFLIMLQVAAYGGDDPEVTVVIVACDNEGQSPNDTPLTEWFFSDEGVTQDEAFDTQVAKAREGKLYTER